MFTDDFYCVRLLGATNETAARLLERGYHTYINSDCIVQISGALMSLMSVEMGKDLIWEL